MALYLALEKKRNIFLLSVGKYLEVVWSYQNDFREMIIIDELG